MDGCFCGESVESDWNVIVDYLLLDKKSGGKAGAQKTFDQE